MSDQEDKLVLTSNDACDNQLTDWYRCELGAYKRERVRNAQWCLDYIKRTGNTGMTLVANSDVTKAEEAIMQQELNAGFIRHLEATVSGTNEPSTDN